MTPLVDSLIKTKGNFYGTGIAIRWNFVIASESGSETIEKSGLYDITTKFHEGIQEFHNARTEVTTYYDIFNHLKFSDPNSGASFILRINRILTVDYVEQNLVIEFQNHPSSQVHAFEINSPIISGNASISGEENQLISIMNLIRSNMLINDEFPISRCEQCNSLMALRGDVNIEQELVDSDFVCLDCYNVANEFFDILTEELTQISDPSIMAQQRGNLIALANGGKSFAIDIDDLKLQSFFDALIIQVNFFAGAIDHNSALKLLYKILRTSQKNGYDSLSAYINALKECLVPLDVIENSVPEGISLENDIQTPKEENVEDFKGIPQNALDESKNLQHVSATLSMMQNTILGLDADNSSSPLPAPVASPPPAPVASPPPAPVASPPPAPVASPPPAPVASPPPAPVASPPPAPVASPPPAPVASPPPAPVASPPPAPVASQIQGPNSLFGIPIRKSVPNQDTSNNVENTSVPEEITHNETNTEENYSSMEEKKSQNRNFGFMGAGLNSDDSVKATPFSNETQSGANLENVKKTKRKRHRSRICSFCGAVVKQGMTICPGCGSQLN